MLITAHKLRGVTLVELMIAIVISAILFGIGANSFSGWIQNQKTRVAAESILNGLQLTRSEAVKRNAAALFVMCGNFSSSSTDSSWDVLAASATASDVACGGTPTPSGWERVQQRGGQEGSRNVTITTGGGGVNAIAFNGMGGVVTVPVSNLTNLGKTVTQPALTTNPIMQVDVANPQGDRPLRILVQVGGSIRMCDPSSKLQSGDPLACN